MVADQVDGQRRASYGPTSPRVGLRGGQTRELIVAETLNLFTRRGFQDTTVHDIADAAEISRAALYQYFASKDEIFLELLGQCRRQLIEVVGAASPLGPTADGFEHLCSLISQWSHVHDRYGALFLRWASVDLPEDAGESEFSAAHGRAVAHLLAAGGLTAMSPDEAAVVTISVVNRYNFLRFATPGSRSQLPGAVTEVATVLQAVLYPATPREALVDARARDGVPVRDAAVVARARASRAEELLTGLTPRSTQTVRRILQAAAQSFAERGYHRSNVDDIVKLAGFARGTYYKYFSEKLDLLLVLADEYEDAALERIEALAEIPVGPEGAVLRRSWVRMFLQFRASSLGVMRALIDQSPQHPELDETRERFHQVMLATMGTLVETGPLAGVVTAWGAENVMIGAFERLPDALPDTGELGSGRVVELIATVLDRGLLGQDIAGSEEVSGRR